jgi:hypothetical protein
MTAWHSDDCGAGRSEELEVDAVFGVEAFHASTCLPGYR